MPPDGPRVPALIAGKPQVRRILVFSVDSSDQN